MEAHGAPQYCPRMVVRWIVASTLAIAFSSATAAAAPGPVPAGYVLVEVSTTVSSETAGITQLAFRPGDPTHLYATRVSGNVVTRYDVDLATGALSNPLDVATGLTLPYGLAFRAGDLYVSINPVNDSRIVRLRDLNQDGVFEERVDFLRGVPNRDHGIDHLQITGSTLIAGVGTRTNSGRRPPPDECESAYTGTLGRIADLDQVDYSGVGNALPSAVEYVNTVPQDGKLRRYAYGVRNPYGVRVDGLGRIWVSDNGASFCNTCSSCGQFPFDTPDFLYRDVPLGAKGHFPPAGQPGGGGATMSPFVTLATHAAATGFAFLSAGPDSGLVVLAQYGPTNTSIDVGRDVIAIDPVSGAIVWSIRGFNRPTDALEDPFGRVWIADIEQPAIYLLTPPGVTGVDERTPGADAGVVWIERLAPNPVTGDLTVEYALARDTWVDVTILDLAGRVVAKLAGGHRAAGRHEARWTGSNAGGPAPPGLYLLRLETEFGAVTGRVVRVR